MADTQPTGSAFVGGILTLGSIQVIKGKTFFVGEGGEKYTSWASFKRHPIGDPKSYLKDRERV